MVTSTRLTNSPTSSITAERTGLAKVIFPILHSNHAGEVRLETNSVRLKFPTSSSKVLIGKIKSIEIEEGSLYSTVLLYHSDETVSISGLSKEVARGLLSKLERARLEWWKDTLGSRSSSLNAVLSEKNRVLNDPLVYVRVSSLKRLQRIAKAATDNLSANWPQQMSKTKEVHNLRRVMNFLEAPINELREANKKYTERELRRSRTFFDQIESRPLSREQRIAVVTDEVHNRVLAAAGSGKTSVIVAKAGWLLHKRVHEPSHLLLLAFARDARDELAGRLERRLGTDITDKITVSTFHSLGSAIIGEVEKAKPTLHETAEDDVKLPAFIRDIVGELLSNSHFASIIRSWFQGYFAPYQSFHKFNKKGEYFDYLEKFDIRSLNGDKVKSFEECEIANFLFLNGVRHRYEAAYEHRTANTKRRQYKPDFTLLDYGIYIEHFGLDKYGNTAPFVNKEKYLKEMEWKRTLHVENRTHLIETFSHEKNSGVLLRNLAHKLRAQGVTLSPIPDAEIFATLKHQGRIDSFTTLVVTFLKHFKESKLSITDLKQRASTRDTEQRTEAFVKVFQPIFERYQGILSAAGEIDFHDMINRATEYLKTKRYQSSFKYIMVDEFQDISLSRARLLQALLESSKGSQLFAVGDDWQSIYKFGGADLSIMRNFEMFFGEFADIQLSNTFRNPYRLVSVAKKFVLRNPNQIDKKVRAKSKKDKPAVHIGFPDKNDFELLQLALDQIAEDASKYDSRSDVLILARYRHILDSLRSRKLSQLYPSLNFSRNTVHASKGSEADYVVLLGLCSGKYGFPSEMADDPILDLVLTESEGYDNAEERRLLYVALTRAKRLVFLLATDGPPSVFAKELNENDYDVRILGFTRRGVELCSECTRGSLVRRTNASNGKVFYGCERYPLCEYTRKACPHCGVGLPVKSKTGYICNDCGASKDDCVLCDGRMKLRKGKYGRFLGCSNYPTCTYTRNV